MFYFDYMNLQVPRAGEVVKNLIDIRRLQTEVQDLLKKYPFDANNQISLTHREGHQDFYDGVGSLYDFENNKWLHREGEFKCFNADLEKSYLHEVYKTSLEHIPFSVGRVRLMRLMPKTCLSMHIDDNLRFHIPIITNPQCFMVFAEAPPVRLPNNGSLYWTNTIIPHSVFNGHNNEERIHLVFATDAKQKDYLDYLNERALEQRTPNIFSKLFKKISSPQSKRR